MKTELLSDRIVEYIGNLFPLYRHEMHASGRVAARSLADGTLIISNDQDEQSEDGFVLVQWQGDASRTTEETGVFVATIAVAKWAELHGVRRAGHTKMEYEQQDKHFTFKTGASLSLEAPATLMDAVRATVGI